MGAWSGPFLIAALLLGAAGLAKSVDPTMTVGALRGIGLDIPPFGVRAVGAFEAALAVAAAATGAPVLAFGVAVSYVVFTLFVVVALARRLPIGTCGCFGKIDTPPSWIHVGVNLGAAASAVAVAVADGGGIAGVLRAQPAAGIPFLLLVVVGAYAAFTALTVVPKLGRAS
jgi:hypothetical protein